MKTQFAIILLVILNASSRGQISKGRQMIGINFTFSKGHGSSFDSSGTKPMVKETSNSTGIGLRYGYFVTDKIMLGISTSLNGNSSTTESLNYFGHNYVHHHSSNNMGAGAFARYYNILGKSKFATFGQLNINYNRGITTTQYLYTSANSKAEDKHFGISCFLSAGLSCFFNKNIALETSIASIGFSNLTTQSFLDGIKRDEYTNFQVSSYSLFSLSSLNLGLNFYFGGKKKEAEPSVTTPQ